MSEGIPPFDEEDAREAFVSDMTDPETLEDSAERARANVVEGLRLQSTESEQLLDALIVSWETSVGESVIERVGHVQRIAQLYRDAGLYERAFLALQDAGDMAYNEHQDDLLEQIESEMTEIKREAGRI